MISLSQILWGKSGRMDDLLISMDNQLRVYLWTINEMNRIRYASELQNSAINQIRTIKKGVSHYKKRWRDRYIKPDSTPLKFEDPLRRMDQFVNDSHTYHHVIEYKKILSHIVQEANMPQVTVGLNPCKFC